VKNQSNIKQTALYCRTAQRSYFAIESQKSKLIAYAKSNGFENLTLYVDDGFSGVSGNRPAFRELMAQIKAGTVATVLTVSMDRISRNVRYAKPWIRELEKYDVDFISMDNYPLDLLQLSGGAK